MTAIWRTTSITRSGVYLAPQLDQVMCQISDLCVNVTPYFKNLSPESYDDEHHTREPSYRFMNELLLQQVFGYEQFSANL
jgi:hypothetical protein